MGWTVGVAMLAGQLALMHETRLALIVVALGIAYGILNYRKGKS